MPYELPFGLILSYSHLKFLVACVMLPTQVHQKQNLTLGHHFAFFLATHMPKRDTSYMIWTLKEFLFLEMSNFMRLFFPLQNPCI